MASGTGTVGDLVAWMAEARILEPSQQEEAHRLIQKGYAAPRALAKELIARNWITPFQANYLVQGRIQDLLFGQYVIVDRLGEGGMGTVYKAKHQKLGRIVALKVIKKEYLAHPSAAKRFRREIQAATQLKHPNIVQALDSDTNGDVHFYAMEYIEGIDLRRLLKKSGPLPVGQACDYMRQAALGLQHACERGLVHRDIKPANLFVTTKVNKGPNGSNPGTMGPWGLVKILDLGLARAAADADIEMTNTLTCAGAVVGSPDYIAPEQARDSRTADIRSDIYSLGCSFYHLVTNQVPFPGGTGMEKIFKHQIETPKTVREHRPDLGKDVEAVILRMMAKKAEDRYQTPIEIAKALEPLIKKARASGVTPLPDWVAQETVLANDPAGATPPTTPPRKRSKVSPPRTEPAAAGAGQSQRGRRPFWVLVAMGFGGLILLTGLLFAIFSGNDASKSSVSATSTNNSPPTGPGPSTQAKNQSPLDRLGPQRIPVSERQDLPPEAVAVLGEHKLRHWGAVTGVAFNADGTLMATAGADRTIRIWETASGKQRGIFEDGTNPANLLAFAGDGRALISIGYDLTLRVHDISTAAARSSVAIPRTEGSPFALSPDGRTLLLMGTKPKLWDVMQNRERAVLETGAAAIGAFSPNGQFVVTWTRSAQSSEVVIWDAQTALPKQRLPLTKEMVLQAAVANDGKMVALIEGKQLVVVEAAAGQLLGRIDLPSIGAGMMAGFSPDGRSLAFAANGRVQLLSLSNLAKPIWDRRGGNYAQRLAFSPDGSLLATTGYDPVVRLFETATGNERFAGNQFSANQVAFASDGALVSAGLGGIQRWDLANLTNQTIDVPGTWQQMTTLSRDGRRAIVRGSDGISVYDTVSGTRLGQVPGMNMGAWAAFSADGLVAAVVAPTERAIHIYDLTTFQARPAPQGFQVTQGMPTVGLSADGKVLAIADQGQVRLWDTLSGKPLSGLLGQKSNSRYYTLAVSPDGKQVAASGEGTVRLWNASTAQELLQSQDAAVKAGMASMTFSPDGRSLIAWNQQRVLVWDTASGKPRSGFSGGLGIRTVAFSPDGKWVGASDQEGRLHVWDGASGVLRQQIQLPGPASGLAFAADGRHLATANGNGTVFILRLGQHAEKAATAAPARKPWVIDDGREAMPENGVLPVFPLQPDVKPAVPERKPDFRPAIPETKPEGKPVVPDLKPELKREIRPAIPDLKPEPKPAVPEPRRER